MYNAYILYVIQYTNYNFFYSRKYKIKYIFEIHSIEILHIPARDTQSRNFIKKKHRSKFTGEI